GKRSAVPAAHGPGAVRSGVAESPLHLVFGHDLVPGVPGGGQDGTGHFHGVLTGGRGDTGRLLATLSGDRPQAFHARRRGNTGGDGHVVMDAPTRGDALRGANMDLLLTEDPREGRRLVGVEGVEGDVSHWGFLSGFVSRAPDHEWSAAQANTWSAPSTPGTGPVRPDAHGVTANAAEVGHRTGTHASPLTPVGQSQQRIAVTRVLLRAPAHEVTTRQVATCLLHVLRVGVVPIPVCAHRGVCSTPVRQGGTVDARAGHLP